MRFASSQYKELAKTSRDVYTEFILKILSRTKGLFPVQVLQEKALSDLVFCLTKKEGFIKSAQSIVVKRFDGFLKFERKF